MGVETKIGHVEDTRLTLLRPVANPQRITSKTTRFNFAGVISSVPGVISVLGLILFFYKTRKATTKHGLTKVTSVVTAYMTSMYCCCKKKKSSTISSRLFVITA
jgi:UPF0716 family protein affecting phage T7 exclusion